VALLDMVLGYDCNLACDYCTITPEMRVRALSTAAAQRELVEGRAAGHDTVAFTGGEPTIRSDLSRLVKTARHLGYRDVKLQTNGLVFAHAPNVEALVAAGVSRFHVSVHTHEAAAYDALVRRAGAHPLMEAALRNLAARGVVLVVHLILKEDTYRRLPEALDWLHARGVRQVDLAYVSLTDGNRDNLASLPPMAQVLPVMRRAFAWAREHAFTLRSLDVPRCLLGDDAAHAYDPGAQAVRVVTPESTFELRDSKIFGHTHVAACRGCPHEEICPGLRPDYLERWGDGEIAGARGQSPTIAPTRFLRMA
jgi:cyclic pyranopterin phosphate synthase